ncbi:response regulator transcription factor [soil metagenome]
MAKILVVEDDLNLCDFLQDALQFERYTVELVHNGLDALERLRISEYDALILDWSLPEMDGLTLCKQIRAERSKIPILMLTGRDTMPDKLTGLNAGADDYLTKPFDVRELVARVKSLIRRSAGLTSNELRVGPLVLDPEKHLVRKNESEIQLLPTEFALLEFLMRHPDQVFSQEALLQRVWTSESEATSEAIRSCVKRLRKKIDGESGEPLLQTVHGVGYKLRSI